MDITGVSFNDIQFMQKDWRKGGGWQSVEGLLEANPWMK